MATENDHHMIRMVVMVELSLQAAFLRRPSSSWFWKVISDRGVVSTENLQSKALHVQLRVLVQIAGLYNTVRKLQHQCTQRKKERLKYQPQITRPSPSCPA